MSARAPQIGDFIAVRGGDVLGRVVSTSAVVGPTHGCMLVYLYRDAKRPARDALLVPPLLTTRAPWSHGLFEYVRSKPLLPRDYFERHCFRDAHGRYVDEEGRPLPEPREPVGECALQSVDAIEAMIAKALSASTTRRRTSRSSPPPPGTRRRTRRSRSP